MQGEPTGTREGAHIIGPDGRPTWKYDPSWFRAIIDARGLTNGDVERALGVSSGYLGRMLRERAHNGGMKYNGKRYQCRPYMTYNAAVRLAAALQIDPYEVGV